jgi:hypothetical protein
MLGIGPQRRPQRIERIALAHLRRDVDQPLGCGRDRALVAAEVAMKERERDSRDEELLRLKAKLGEVTMANELAMLQELIRER